MATAGRTLRVALVANTKNFRQGMMSAVRDAKGFQGKMGAVATSLRGTLGPALMAAAAAAGALAVKLGVDGVKAAIADQKTVAVLAQTLENLGHAHRQAGVEEFIANLESATGVADEQLRPALGLLLQATGDVDEAQRRLSQAMDLSIGTGNSLDGVVRALARSLATGTAGTLSRYGIMIDQNTLKTEGFGVALDQAATKFSGIADQEAKTLEGQLRILQTELGNLQEAFGYGFLNGIGAAEEGVSDFNQAIRDLKPAMEDLGETVGNVFSAVGDLAGGYNDAKGAVDNFIGSNDTLRGALDMLYRATIGRFDIGQYAQQVQALSREFDNTADSVDGAGRSMGTAMRPTGDFAKVLAQTADDAEDVNDELSQLEEHISNVSAILAYEAAWDDLRKTLDENGKALDYGSKAGRENNQALLDFAQATADAAAQQDTMFGKVAYVQDALKNLSKIFDTTKMSDATKAAMLAPFEALISDLDLSQTDLATLQTMMDKLQNKDITITTRFNFPDGRPPGGWPKEWYGAKGGLVPQYMASGGMSRGADTVPAMLAPGEFVMRRSAVKQFGSDLFSQLNRGINPLAGMDTGGGSRGAGVNIGQITVQSAPGESAETSLPRALRRMAFLAGVNG